MIPKEIAIKAKQTGICKEWFADMIKKNNLKTLCEMYFKGSDWAMENNFPTLEMLRDTKETEQYGLFTDFSGVVPNFIRLAFFGKSDVEIIAENYDVKEIYIRHDSTLKLKANGESKVFISVLDNAKVQIECEGNAVVNVYAYGNLGNIECKGQNISVLKSDFN